MVIYFGALIYYSEFEGLLRANFIHMHYFRSVSQIHWHVNRDKF